ncbi:MAG: penicillin-binding protein 1B [Woeseiaceae bacterium]|nr:penicillin-binding protein 1B [Woeseiaceae bacterium]
MTKAAHKNRSSGPLPVAGWLAARFRRGPKRFIALALFAILLAYVLVQSLYVIIAFEGRRWDIPARVYAAPLELYPGLRLTRDELAASLAQTGYKRVAGVSGPGQYRVASDLVALRTRDFRHWDGPEPGQQLLVRFEGDRVASIRDAAGQPVPIARLEPVRLGSLFAAHHEDRILVAPDEIPPLLVAALKAVEDRRFDEHSGLDLRGILRAAFVNLRHREIRQGGSTLTQQLVKSYFLDGRQTFRRKFREAVMAVALELRYDKDELLHAYINEIYLGQQGARAIHGFGLASEFYFSRRLAELELADIALLVALVNGPSWYDPRRHPERALERRNFVLGILVDRAVVSPADAEAAAARQLGISTGSRLMSRYQPAYMDLVRRQLAADYDADELAREGLSIFTSLDPQVQAQAERRLADGLLRLTAAGRDPGRALEGAVIVTRYQTGDVIAMVGGRDVEFDGFNRVLSARRPAGSLVKPVVYLAAFETGSWTLASRIADAPLAIELENGDTWSPANFDATSHGEVPLLRALAESYNQATVALGMAVGVDTVARRLHALGLREQPAANPSLLLGAVEATPFEMALVYGSLANGGFRVPLRAVRSVITEDGEPLGRYPLELEPVADPAAVQQVNAALVQVIERGTGRSARNLLPRDLVAAGKTGTSSDLRDSWFAGFTNEHLAVVWVGHDDNAPAGLTGASGALSIWASLVGGFAQSTSFSQAPAAGLEPVWLDYATGLSTYNGCGDAVLVPLPADSRPPRVTGCRRGLKELRERARDWLGGNGQRQ